MCTCSTLKVSKDHILCLYVSGALGSVAVDSLVPADEASRRGSEPYSLQQPGRLTEQDLALQPPQEPQLPTGKPGSAHPPSVAAVAWPTQRFHPP